ncbi:hypothetical protein HanHA300_Chr17g0636661 [Helianthus annuus]|nr:hypothetical protein HanHA300_Chr17g0636661 [Helianthus annuus]
MSFHFTLTLYVYVYVYVYIHWSLKLYTVHKSLCFFSVYEYKSFLLYYPQVQTPSGTARTHKFATKTLDLPAQEGERVTIASAAPSSVYREVGPLKFSPKAPNYYPGEPMSLTNHLNGKESPLIRAPTKNGALSLFSPTVFFPLLAVFASGDAASGMIDPSLPQIISVAAVSSAAVGSTLNGLVFPQFNRVSFLADVTKYLLHSPYHITMRTIYLE